MLVPQAHLIVSWWARGRLSVATWTAMAPGHTVAEKGGSKPLLFLRLKTRVSAEHFYASLSLSSPPRKMRKNARQRLTSVAVAMAVWRPPWCITVCPWSFVLILCYFVYLDIRAHVACARARACVPFRDFLCFLYKLNKISRFHTPTPKTLNLDAF